MKSVFVLPGDGIGPETVGQALRVLEHLQKVGGLEIRLSEGLVGGASIDQHGVPLTEETAAQALASDAVLLGAVGGPKWSDVAYHLRPEQGLLDLRKAMGLFANLRPATCFPALVDASSLKPELVEGLDIMVVRELIGGVYFGEPRGIETLADGQKRGVNTQAYSTHEVRRVARVAFELARQRDGRVCSVEKSNVMESGIVWREAVTALHAEEFSDVGLSHMYADNCAMQLVREPKQFDVIVTDNLFGDILSDAAAMLTGSLGMLPSASLGTSGAPGLYEPIHGSAPDIAGQNIANPCATILSVAMALRWQLGRADLAECIETAVNGVLGDGLRTRDILRATSGAQAVSTSEFTDAIIRKL
ncbi:MAG: 3-isopropylmalate dehydrogenase [Hyphomonadaceae bacterium]|nr:3-isopropylmalate dehydrogenase [Hyphomonadaceae bacterium]